MASGDQMVIENPGNKQQANQRQKRGSERNEDQFDKMSEVTRKWKNDIIVICEYGQ